MLQHGYKTGEWLANITADHISIWYPDGADYKVYVQGAASAVAKAPQYVLKIDSTEGKLKGALACFEPKASGRQPCPAHDSPLTSVDFR